MREPECFVFAVGLHGFTHFCAGVTHFFVLALVLALYFRFRWAHCFPRAALVAGCGNAVLCCADWRRAFCAALTLMLCPMRCAVPCHAVPCPAFWTGLAVCQDNHDSMEACAGLSRGCRVPPAAFGFAGTKDKRAITTQHFTVFKVRSSPAWPGLAQPSRRSLRLSGPLALALFVRLVGPPRSLKNRLCEWKCEWVRQETRNLPSPACHFILFSRSPPLSVSFLTLLFCSHRAPR